MDTEGTANITLNVLNSTANDLEESMVLYWADGGGANDINMIGNNSTNHGGPDDFPHPAVFSLHTESHSASMTFDIQGNTPTDSGEGILIFGGGTIQGRIGGPNPGDGIRLDIGGTSGNPASGNATILVQNNDISSGGTHTLADDALQILHRDTSGTLNLTIEDNTFGNSVSEGIRFFGDEDAGLGGNNPSAKVRIVDNAFSNTSTGLSDLDMILRARDTADTCFFVSGNDNGSGGSPGEIDLDQGGSSTLEITQASAGVLATANNGATVSTNGTITFNGGCTNPALPTSASAVPDSGTLLAQRMNHTLQDEMVEVEPAMVGLEEINETERVESAPAVQIARTTVERSARRGPGLASPVRLGGTASEFSAPLLSGENININLGTLDPGQTVTITFDATVDNPTAVGVNQVCNQGLVSSSNHANVLTDDPDVGGSADPTCTDLDDATITVEKVLVGNPPGTDWAYTGDLGNFALPAAGGQTSFNVSSSSYIINETAKAGYASTVSCTTGDNGTDSVTVGAVAGQEVTCTFNNKQLLGTVVIHKAASPAGGTGFGFSDDIAAPNSFSLDDGQSETFLNVVAGTYTVSEDNPCPFYALIGMGCVDPDGGSLVSLGARSATIDLDAGETVECTFVNESQTGTIIIEKVTDPSGDPTLFDFMLTGGPSNLNQAFQLSDGQTYNSGDIVTGSSYNATESAPAGWSLASATCDDGSPVDNINVSPNETVTCTFNNDLQKLYLSSTSNGNAGGVERWQPFAQL